MNESKSETRKLFPFPFRWVFAIAAIVGIPLGVIVGSFLTAEPEVSSPASPSRENEVRTVGVDCVKQALTAPSSSRFPWTVQPEVHRQTDGTYVVTGYVDSQNGFGAMIRSNYRAVVRHKCGGAWACESVELD